MRRYAVSDTTKCAGCRSNSQRRALFGTHSEGCLHLGLEDVTFEVVGEHRWGSRRVQRLFRQLLLLSLPGEQGEVRRLNLSE